MPGTFAAAARKPAGHVIDPACRSRASHGYLRSYTHHGCRCPGEGMEEYQQWRDRKNAAARERHARNGRPDRRDNTPRAKRTPPGHVIDPDCPTTDPDDHGFRRAHHRGCRCPGPSLDAYRRRVNADKSRHRDVLERPVHPLCESTSHGDDPTCVCPTRRQREHDAKGGHAIPEKDAAIEAEFTAMPGPNHEATVAERAFYTRTDLVCRNERVDLELFYPIGGRWQSGQRQEAAAKAVCRRCPAQQACLELALRTGDAWAVLGGKSAEERREINRQRQRQAREKDAA